MFENLFRIFTGERKTPTNEQQTKDAVMDSAAEANIVFDRIRFKGDIEALTAEYGDLRPGMTLEMTLSHALDIMPRDRKRVDGYIALVKYLKEKGITLIIKSQKTK